MPRKSVKLYVDKMIPMYEAGKTIYEIGDVFGFHGATVARALRVANVSMKIGGRRKEENLPRFMLKVKKTLTCWLWTGKINVANGYGVFLYHPEKNAPAREYAAHRCAYLLFIGPIPNNKVVRHTCDNKWCVNPKHLKLGTYLDNMQDAVVRGRIATGDKVQAKLDVSKVRKIRKLRKKGMAIYKIAKLFEVDLRSIERVLSGESYPNVK